MLTRTQYLKSCLLLPFVGAPLSLALVFSSAILPLPDWLLSAATIGWMAIFMFGLPYALLAGVAAVLLRGRSWRTHVLVALIAPFLMLLAIVAALWLSGDRDPAGTLAVFAPSCLATGYFYVSVAFAGWLALSRRGWLAPDAAG